MKTIPYHEIQESLNNATKLSHDPTILTTSTLPQDLKIITAIFGILIILTFCALLVGSIPAFFTLLVATLVCYFVGAAPMIKKEKNYVKSIKTESQIISQNHYLKAYNLSESTSTSIEHSNFILAGSASAKANSSIDYVVYQTVDHTFDSGFQLKQYPSDDKYNPVVVHEMKKDDKTKPYVEELTTIKWYRHGDKTLGYRTVKYETNIYVPEGAIVTNESFDTSLLGK